MIYMIDFLKSYTKTHTLITRIYSTRIIRSSSPATASYGTLWWLAWKCPQKDSYFIGKIIELNGLIGKLSWITRR